MGIVIIRQDGKIPKWKEVLEAISPSTKIYSYLEEHPKEKITMAVVWKHPEGVLQHYPNLKCIASAGAGVDFIFDDPDLPKNIAVTRVVDPLLVSDMSEFVIALVFNHLKNLGTYKADQINNDWNPTAYKPINDATIGIMGMGKLGIYTARDLRQFGFRVQGWANSPKQLDGIKTFVGSKELSVFLKNTSILVCLLPLTMETTGILNRTLFQQLPKEAFIINVARGAHLVDADLLEQLDKGHLSGASLDVFHNEPLPKEHPFWNHPKVHITPHIASVSHPGSVVPQIMENYTRLQTGQPLLNRVDILKGY